MNKFYSLLTSLLLATFFAGSLSAQFYVTEEKFSPSGVSNEGVVVGSTGQSTPHQLWSPLNEGSLITIGGISAGKEVSGIAKISSDGEYVYAPMRDENIALPKGWIDESIGSVFNYTIVKIYRLPGVVDLFAIGVDADKSESVILASTNSGRSWVEKSRLQGVLSVIAFIDTSIGFVGGHNGAEGVMYTTSDGGDIWTTFDPRPEGYTGKVKAYSGIIAPHQGEYGSINGIISLELEDGTGAAWYTADKAKTFIESTGVLGVPTSISNTGGNFFMTTREGHILKSTDKGKTWTQVLKTINEAAINRILFSEDNPQNGIAVSRGHIYHTQDAGATWIPVDVPTLGTMLEDYTWSDICWVDDKTAFISGVPGICQTKDMGKTWEEVYKATDKTGLYSIDIASDKSVIVAGGNKGLLCKKYLQETISAYVAATYDIESDTWTPLPSFGYGSGQTMSSPWGISGNGRVVLGSASTFKLLDENSKVHVHATAWVDGKPVDLGSKFADRGRETRAEASSFDGSVIVGWQDIFGPWFGSVWRRDAEGKYEQKMCLKDPTKKEEEINYSLTPEGRADMQANLLGHARAVSSDGKWIGGRGSSPTLATDGAWIWSEETGLKELTPGYDATVSDMNNDASMVVGWYGPGGSAWIWTEEMGLKSLNSYLKDDLGFDLQGFFVGSVYDMSANGRYLTGYCIKGDDIRGYLVDLSGDDVSTGLIEQINAAVYPNPVADELHIDVPFSNVETAFTLYDMQGRVVRTMTTTSVSNVMNVSDIASGLYILNVEADNARRAFKVEIR